MDEWRRPRRQALAAAYTAAVVRFRWAVVAGLALVTVLAGLLLPGLGSSGAGLSGLVGEHTPATRAQVDAVARFGCRCSAAPRSCSAIPPGWTRSRRPTRSCGPWRSSSAPPTPAVSRTAT